MKASKLISTLLILMMGMQIANAQDKLFFKSGKELPVIIKKETADEIYYVNTGNDSAQFMILKSGLKQINYANGDTMVFNTDSEMPVDSVKAAAAGWKTGVPNATYYCWLYGDTAFSYKIRKGYIRSVADSGIYFSGDVSGTSFFAHNRELKYLDVSNIEQINIRRRGDVGKGILIGAGIGFFIGAALGAAGIPDYGIFETLPPGENAAAGGIVFSIPGMIIGGIVGSIRVKIPINKNQPQYEKLRKVIASYSNIHVR